MGKAEQQDVRDKDRLYWKESWEHTELDYNINSRFEEYKSK